ncbi:MAG: FHA domain-containing protein, partial [Ktedonobacteraceae bacterium]|nr:FHA domain-containing protein [Ktedonobacteraceae bacterium]
MTAALQGPLGRIALESPRITVGRAQDNQLVVSDPKASAHHAVIQLHGESYTVTDLGSTNGTFVNEQKLDRNIPQFLKSSDKVRIGDTVFIYEYEHPAPSLEDTAIDTNLKSGYEATVKAPPSYVPPGKPLENMPPNPFEPEPPSRPSSPSYPAYGA